MSSWSNRDIFLSFQWSRCGIIAVLIVDVVPVKRAEDCARCCSWLLRVMMERRALGWPEVVSEWLAPMLLGLNPLG